MSKTKYSILLLIWGWGITGCDQDIDFPYEGKDRIQFQHYITDYNGKRVYSDSTVFSFGIKSTEMQEDTVRIIVEFLGSVSDKDRMYYVTVNPDSTTAVAGKHYKAFSREQIFGAGRWTDTLKILAYRKELSPSFSNPKSERIQLALEPSDDFDLGLTKGRRLTLLLNNYLSEPAWWGGNFQSSLGFYHPQKWRILMSFHEDFNNPSTCRFDINNEGRGYVTGLTNYLNAIPTFDEETGYRIYMNSMVPVE